MGKMLLEKLENTDEQNEVKRSELFNIFYVYASKVSLLRSYRIRCFSHLMVNR